MIYRYIKYARSVEVAIILARAATSHWSTYLCNMYIQLTLFVKMGQSQQTCDRRKELNVTSRPHERDYLTYDVRDRITYDVIDHLTYDDLRKNFK